MLAKFYNICGYRAGLAFEFCQLSHSKIFILKAIVESGNQKKVEINVLTGILNEMTDD